MKKLLASATIAGIAVMCLFNSCKKTDPLLNEEENTVDEAGRYSDNHGGYRGNTTFYALAGGVRLDKYKTSRPTEVIGTANISGLQENETILAIDFRPATGELYGVGNSSRLYIINTVTGTARTPAVDAFTPAISGSIVGFDFNPTVDRIRLVTSTGQNLRLNPETGTVAATDGSIKLSINDTILRQENDRIIDSFKEAIRSSMGK